MADINYERDIKIDEKSLDIEWLEQPTLALKYARHYSYLNDEVRRLEEQKKIIRSKLILEVNQNPKELIGKDKPNSSDIEAFYRAHKDYQKIVNELNDAIKEAEFAGFAKDEICYTRKKALENLVNLHAQQYFAGPNVPRNLSYEKQQRDRQKNVNSKVKIGGDGETPKRTRKRSK